MVVGLGDRRHFENRDARRSAVASPDGSANRQDSRDRYGCLRQLAFRVPLRGPLQLRWDPRRLAFGSAIALRILGLELLAPASCNLRVRAPRVRCSLT